MLKVADLRRSSASVIEGDTAGSHFFPIERADRWLADAGSNRSTAGRTVARRVPLLVTIAASRADAIPTAAAGSALRQPIRHV